MIDNLGNFSKGNEFGDRCHALEQNYYVRKVCVKLSWVSPSLSPLLVMLYSITYSQVKYIYGLYAFGQT